MTLTPELVAFAAPDLPPPSAAEREDDAGRCVHTHPLHGRCGLAAGHGTGDPRDAAHASCVSLSPPMCCRWDGCGYWVERPTPWGDLSDRPLPWAAGYLAGRHAQVATSVFGALDRRIATHL